MLLVNMTTRDDRITSVKLCLYVRRQLPEEQISGRVDFKVDLKLWRLLDRTINARVRSMVSSRIVAEVFELDPYMTSRQFKERRDA